MIIHYGYEDGSGQYYVSIDAEKCNACADCIEVCPEKILAMEEVMIDLDFKQAAAVLEAQRKKIKYTCASCHEGKGIPCVQACEKGAIAATWETK
jgi:Fe-S-cluster-containing hydrogenase component 2